MVQVNLNGRREKAIKRYLAQDCAKEQKIRSIVCLSKKHLPTIEADLVLLRKLLLAYK